MKKYNPYKVLIITCWAMLGICCILKILGANWFEASVSNTNAIKFFEFIDNKLWIKQLLGSSICLILVSLVILSELKQKFYTLKQGIVFIPLIVIMSYSGWYIPILNTILSIIIYLLPIIWLRKEWYKAFIGLGLVFVFQLVSLITKNIGDFGLFETSYSVGVILQIDTFIMALLYYLYSNKHNYRKEV